MNVIGFKADSAKQAESLAYFNAGAAVAPPATFYLALLVGGTGAARNGSCQELGNIQATATANLSGGSVASFHITAHGSGYNPSSPPSVTISGGGGTGATALAVVSGDGVSGINVLTAGSGYTSSPTVTIVDNGYARTAIANNATNWTVSSNGKIVNALQINLSVPTAGWAEVLGWALFDAATAGTLWFAGTIPGTVFGPSNSPHVPVGTLVIQP